MTSCDESVGTSHENLDELHREESVKVTIDETCKGYCADIIIKSCRTTEDISDPSLEKDKKEITKKIR